MKQNLINRLLLVGFLILGPQLNAQMRPEMRQKAKQAEKVESLMVAEITLGLDLSSEEAKSFWPLYNEYRNEMKAQNEKMKEIQRSNREKFDQLSEQEQEELLMKLLELEASLTEIRKRYVPKFSNELGMKRTAKLYTEERKFQRKVMRKMREQRIERGR